MKKLFTILLAVLVLGTCATSEMSAKKRNIRKASSAKTIKDPNELSQFFVHKPSGMTIAFENTSNRNDLFANVYGAWGDIEIEGSMSSNGKVVMFQKGHPEIIILDGFFYSQNKFPYEYFKGRFWNESNTTLEHEIN